MYYHRICRIIYLYLYNNVSFVDAVNQSDNITHNTHIIYTYGFLLQTGLSPLEEQIFNRILRRKRLKSFSPSLRCFAGTLHFLSPKAYKYVRKTVIKCLPHPKTVGI